MNYMEQITQLLGVELYEEFNIDVYKSIRYRFTEHGLEFFSEDLKEWRRNNLYIYKIFTGEYKIVKLPKPILDDVEKKYLSNIIKPFRDCIKFISKYGSSDYEYVTITYYDKRSNKDYNMYFPDFEKGTMYKGMKRGEHYILEELGL